jgi:hypothetical protein
MPSSRGPFVSNVFFNIVVDMLAILIERAKEGGQVGGLFPHLVEGGISVLQYADGTILFWNMPSKKLLIWN